MRELNAAVVALNKRHEDFWRSQAALMEARMCDDIVVHLACELVDWELQNKVPIRIQTPFHRALEFGERARRVALREQGRGARRARPPDPLQELIVQIVRWNRDISAPQLLARLRDRCPAEPIAEIDEREIGYTARDGRLKQAKISGLKDRLSRAKKHLKSR